MADDGWEQVTVRMPRVIYNEMEKLRGGLSRNAWILKQIAREVSEVPKRKANAQIRESIGDQIEAETGKRPNTRDSREVLEEALAASSSRVPCTVCDSKEMRKIYHGKKCIVCHNVVPEPREDKDA
jgi:hypothetical protein